MNPNLLNIATIAAFILFMYNINIQEVQANPLPIDKDEKQVGIYTDNRWNNDETEHVNRNTWIVDLNNINGNEDCNNGRGACGTQQQSILDMPTKKEMGPSRGWGAGGMPFNILYMKNPKPNQSLKSQLSSQQQPAMIGIIAEPLRSQPLLAPIPQAQQQFEYPRGYKDTPDIGDSIAGDIASRSTSPLNGALSIRNARPKSRSSNSLFVPSRRHYSIIPQLFVSYGWGPIGK